MQLNQKLNLNVPEGFHVLSEAERSRLNFIADGEGCCLQDAERHIMVSVGWKKTGAFAGLILNTGDVAKRLESSIRNAMKPFHYRAEEKVELCPGGKKAEGIRYVYDAQGVEMTGESCVLKVNKTLYYFNFYTRKALQEENRKVWEDLLQSMHWA